VNLRRFRIRRDVLVAGATEVVSHDMVVAAMYSAVTELGLDLLLPHGDGIGRVYGPPGTLDPYLLTEIWFGEDTVRVDCAVPVLVPEDRLEQVLELCLGLNTQGRVAFALGTRGTPIASHNIRLVAAATDLAYLCQGALEVTWERAAAAEELFRAVVEGADAESVLRSIDFESNPQLFNALPINRVAGAAAEGVEWRGLLEQSPPLDDDVVVPDGHTESEWRAAAVAIQLCAAGTELVDDVCAGPLLFHADGVVECYGCAQPGLVLHLDGCIGPCAAGKYLGHGHRCERCGRAE
jgi:hypothetical protein